MRGNMKKSELKNLIQIYAEIKNEIFKKSEIVDIKKGGRIIKINIKPWMFKFPEYLYLINSDLQKDKSMVMDDCSNLAEDKLYQKQKNIIK